MSQKILLDFPDYHLLVCHPTGVFYTAQVGGHSCHHPEEEGFVIMLYQIKEFDLRKDTYDFDCEHLCWYEIFDSRNEMDQSGQEYNIDECKARRKLIPVLNERLKGYYFYLEDRNANATLEIDSDRIHLLTEGWWPVRLNMLGEDRVGIVHFSNCD